jgi:hypothetical protein
MLGRLFGGGGSRDEIADRTARRDFDGAIRLIRKELERDGASFSRRAQLSDVLALAGRPEESARILDVLAGEMVSQGFTAKAIALLKKSQRVLPGQPEVEKRLAALVRAKEEEMSLSFRGVLKPPPVIGDEPAPARAPRTLESELSDIADEMMASGGPLPAGGGQVGAAGKPVVITPLFGEFSEEELVEVIRGLTLQSFEPGDVIVTEGETGGSLFVVTTGLVKAFTRNDSGRSVKVRELGEGDFFGEISVMTGNPRSATVTAATPCELLELDRKTLDSIVAVHPHVWTVMGGISRQRAGTPERGDDSPASAAG